MTNNSEILDQIMRDRKISADEVARILGRTKKTVYQWRCNAQPMPRHQLELLQFKLSRMEGSA